MTTNSVPTLSQALSSILEVQRVLRGLANMPGQNEFTSDLANSLADGLQEGVDLADRLPK